MKKIFLILLLTCLYSAVSFAQSSMSDSQVIDFVLKEQKAGSSQAQIVTKLMQKGVDIQQIRRIKKQYDSKLNSKGLGAISNKAMDETETRMRKNNGEAKDLSSKKVSGTKDAMHTYDENDEDFIGMQKEMSTMMPDTRREDSELLDEEMKVEKGPKVFGRDIFNNKNLTFEPNMNIATPQNYRLGPGDAIYIDIYGGTQKTVEKTISPDGEVTIEGYGPVHISGLTVDQANAKLRSTLGSRYASSKLKLTVGQTRTIMVNVMGEVKLPGTYTLSAFATVFHALYMAGGISDIGTLRNIKVFRQGRLVSQVDVYDYILNGKLTGNVRLTDNDVIVVGPYDCLVNIAGKVKRPMYYEMKKNESMQSLLKYAGGFANDAYTQAVRVVRKTGKQYAVYNVTEFDMSSFHVADGDSVSVDSIISRYENMVEVKGAVFRPGMYQLGNEVNSVKTLLQMANGVTEEAFTARGVMHRLKKDRTLEVIPVDVQGILDGTTADIPLKNEDVLFIPTRQISQEERTITIHGEVMMPGVYQYADNETLEDFVLQAGGLKNSASMMKVDVARRKVNPEAMTSEKEISETFSFKLKEGFVVEGESGFKLQPYDEVYVRKNPTFNNQKNVSVEGQVNFSGVYSLTKKDTRLTDILASAGGVTADAYVKGARLERMMTQDERLRRDQLIKAAKLNANKEDSVNIAKLDVEDRYYVGIDLEKAIKEPGGNYDVVMREGDRLIIPEFNGTVKVNGCVMYPNTLSYSEGRSASWYIKRAGGYGNMAKKSKTYIIHQSGVVEEVSYNTKVTPGSEIVVPEKIKKENNPQNTALLISSVSALATVGAVIVSAFK